MRVEIGYHSADCGLDQLPVAHRIHIVAANPVQNLREQPGLVCRKQLVGMRLPVREHTADHPQGQTQQHSTQYRDDGSDSH